VVTVLWKCHHSKKATHSWREAVDSKNVLTNAAANLCWFYACQACHQLYDEISL